MGKSEKAPRLSNYELLRIVSMILIVMHHYSYHGGFDFWYFVPANKILVQFLCIGGKLGVNCFVLISGYFLSSNPGGIPWKGVLKFVLQVTLFSLAISLFGWALGLIPVTPGQVLMAVFPLLYREWWFANVYFVLLLLSPILNKFIQGADRKTHFSCMVTLLVLWSVVPTILGAYTENNDLTWFVTLYILAAYIRKYNTSFFTCQKRQALLLALSTGLIWLSVLIYDFVGYRQKINFSLDEIMFLAQMNSPLLALQSVALFCIFHNMKIQPSRAINTLAAAMFGVYLIHDSNLLRPWLWQEVFDNAAYQYSPYLFLHAAGAIAAVFGVCTVLSMGYNRVAGNWANGIYEAIQRRKEKKS